MGTTNLKKLPLFGLGTSSKSANVSAQVRENLYVEITGDPEKGAIALYPTPGRDFELDLGATPVRGLYAVGNFRYAVHRNIFYKIENDNTFETMGTLATGAGRVDMSDNGAQIIIVDGPNGYIYTIETESFEQITADGFPGGDTVTFLNSRFIVNEPNSSRFFVSGILDGTSWNALDFATAESNPDQLIRVIANNGQLILFGEETTEFWGNSGALDFPFARIGASAIEWGLAARWSLVKFSGSLIFLRKNRLGASQVCVMKSYQAIPVSSNNLDNDISIYNAVSDATGLSYMVSGHPMYQINFPTANVSWLYDGLSNSWSKLTSSVGRHKSEIQYNHLNRSFVSNFDEGIISTINPETLTDNDEPIVREFISRHQDSGNWGVFDEVWLEMESGVGIAVGQGEDPVIMMQYSKDGGHAWSQEIWVTFGKIGKYRKRAVWRRLGRSRDWLFKFRVTDPVKTVFVEAWGRGGG